MARFVSQEEMLTLYRKKSCGCCAYDDSLWVEGTLGFILILMVVLVVSGCAPTYARRDPLGNTVGGAAIGAVVGGFLGLLGSRDDYYDRRYDYPPAVVYEEYPPPAMIYRRPPPRYYYPPPIIVIERGHGYGRSPCHRGRR